MWPPTRIKDVQKLAGCLAALSWFISRLAELALPFFELLQKSGPFIWSNDAEEAFEELKRYLTTPLVMVAPELGEPLLLYIVATSEVVSMVQFIVWPDPHGLHELFSSSIDGSGSQDPGPTEEPGATDELGSQDPGPAEEPGTTGGSGSPNPGPVDEPRVDAAAGSQSPEAAMGPRRHGRLRASRRARSRSSSRSRYMDHGDPDLLERQHPSRRHGFR
jgi:hypothetical protein